MKNKSLFFIMLFSCLTLSAQQEEKPQPVEGAIIVNFIEGAIRQAYPVVKKQAANWLYNQLFSVTTPISLGLTVGVGVAATGLTIFVMYKIYDKYLRKELTKEQTEQEISNAIYAMVSDDLTYPTYSAKIHVLLKKDEFLNYLDDTDEIFTESCNKTIAKVTDAKSKRDAAKDGAIDAKMNDITKQMVSMTSNAQKLKYVTDTYINDKNKFPMFVYTVIDVVEQWSLQFIGGSLSEKDMNALNQKIKSFKEYLLSNLTIEQRAAYSLYLRLKNKTAVEKLLSAEQKAIRNPWKV